MDRTGHLLVVFINPDDIVFFYLNNLKLIKIIKPYTVPMFPYLRTQRTQNSDQEIQNQNIMNQMRFFETTKIFKKLIFISFQVPTTWC